MAENAPTVFNVHVPEFVDGIWVALRDPTLAVRERAVESLHACLHVIEKGETRWRVHWVMNFSSSLENRLIYLEDEDGATRRDASLCCCKLVANFFSGIACAQFRSSRYSRTGGKRRRLVEIVEKLLTAAVADADVNPRLSVFSSLHGNEGFDEFLAQADSLSAVFCRFE